MLYLSYGEILPVQVGDVSGEQTEILLEFKFYLIVISVTMRVTAMRVEKAIIATTLTTVVMTVVEISEGLCLPLLLTGFNIQLEVFSAFLF